MLCVVYAGHPLGVIHRGIELLLGALLRVHTAELGGAPHFIGVELVGAA